MRRTLLLLLFLVVLGAGVFYLNEKMGLIYPPLTPPKKEILTKPAKPESLKTEEIALYSVPSLFPSGPMVWLHSTDSGEIIRQIKKSNFYKQAVEYKIIDSSKPFPVKIETTTSKKSILSKISSQLEEQFLMDIFGREAGLAFYPADKAGSINYLFAAQISTITKIQEKLNRLKNSIFGSSATVSEKKYNNKTIVIYQNQEQKNSFQYVIFKNIFLGSSSDILLKKGIDLMEAKENNRFVDSTEFKSFFKTSDLSKAGLFFMDIEKIIPNISKYIAPSQKVASTTIEDTKKELEPFKYLGFTFTIREGIKIKSRLTINTKKANRKLIETLGLEPRESKSLSFISDKVIIYGVNIYNPAYFFNEFARAFGTGKIKKNADKKTFEEFLRKSTGINLKKDIIPFIGNEFFYSVFASEKVLPLPVPDITIGFEIKNKNKIELLLKKLEPDMAKSLQQKSFQRESYKKYRINYLPTPIGIQPGYSFVNNFLLLSINQTGIKRLIDTLEKEILPLKKSKNFIAAKIPKKNNGLFFINAALLWDNLSEVITKMPVNFLPTSPQQPLEIGIKFLDIIRAVQSISGTFMYEKNKINANAFIAVKDIPKIRTNKELLVFLEKIRQKTVSPLGSLASSQALASYDYTYSSAGKRDPFQSLIARIEMEDEKFDKFSKDIKSIKPVNLYFYNKIKKKDPVLYKKLKSYARFFKNKKAMEKLPLGKRVQKLEDYRQLIDIARTGFHDTVLRPLQNEEYSSLKLIGIIWGKLGSIALIETPDGKGHTVEVNDMIGPNYGIIKKIEKNKIIVVEQYINYIEKITKKHQEIKLPKKEDTI